jgi:hypothetical protein
MTVFLPLLDQADESLLQALARIGPIIIPSLRCHDQALPVSHYILADHDTSVDVQEIISWLNEGAEKVVVPLVWAKELIGVVPADRLIPFATVSLECCSNPPPSISILLPQSRGFSSTHRSMSYRV